MMGPQSRRRLLFSASLALVFLSACMPSRQLDRLPTLAATLTFATQPIATRVTATPKSSTSTPLPLPTATFTPSPSPTLDAPPPQVCQKPPDDYQRVTIGKQTINARTLWMLQLAQTLYQGRGDPLNVVQGSYTDAVAASFGTHVGGGAVDISVRVKDRPATVLDANEMAELVKALRQAGFAAWARLPGDLSPATTIHIHAIAIGDRELSEAARRQLDGPAGYFRGLNGIPPENGGTQPDRYGGPIVCEWMKDIGFNALP
jgi:hypothetical protein